ncbi:succinyl-CoA synthetase subunit beta [Rhodobacterales bacterium HTCC2150]|nr:succinyl-CoA synthetase subunit beta [Rhodobacterales bacterium HTCC2150] [Rhodobacteraceae bacterium HTCC2150]
MESLKKPIGGIRLMLAQTATNRVEYHGIPFYFAVAETSDFKNLSHLDTNGRKSSGRILNLKKDAT